VPEASSSNSPQAESDSQPQGSNDPQPQGPSDSQPHVSSDSQPQGGARLEPKKPEPPSRQFPVKVYFEGRYRKLTRDLPQTLFYCPECRGKGCDRCEGFGKLTRDSVQELIAWVAMPRFKGRRNKFHGAGREDLNVRMLGDGRPFVMEILKAKRPDVDLEELAAEINRRNEGRLEISGLRYTNRKRVVELKEMKACKDYRALVRFADGVESDVGACLAELQKRGRLDLVQSTPTRVAHRRANLDRERWIEILEYGEADAGANGEAQWWITMRSQHGTYIKEAISSDEGRTKPSIAEWVGAPAECAELDVVGILPEVEEDAAGDGAADGAAGENGSGIETA
jgi:tRNA pseudouridine synthase 10